MGSPFVPRLSVLFGVERSGDISTFLRPSVSEQKQKTYLQCIGSKTGCGALVGRAAHCVLQLAANWQRRVMEVVESFPCRLLLLAKDRPEMDSSERRTVAAEIAAGNFDASSAVGKLKALFGPETEHARCTGELCPVLFQLICDMGRVWNTDVQEMKAATTRFSTSAS